MLPKLADMDLNVNNANAQPGKSKKVGTYTEIGAVYDVVNGSRFGERTVNWSILMQQLSVCTVYFSFVSTNIASLNVVENMHELDRRTAEIIVMCLMYFPCIIMVCRSKSMNDFKLVSKFCNLLLALCFLSVVVVGELGWVVANESSGGKVADSGAVLKTALAFSTVLYSFEGVCLVLPIYASHPRDNGKMSFSVTYVLALTTVVAVYLAFGLWCKWKFGNVTDGSVTAFISDNVVPDKKWAVDGINVMLSVVVFFTYPMQFFPAGEILDLFEEGGRGKGSEVDAAYSRLGDGGYESVKEGIEEEMARATDDETDIELKDLGGEEWGGNVKGKVAAVTVTFAIAAIVPSLGLLLSLAGSLAGSLSSLILPGVMWGGIKGWTMTMAVVVGIGILVGAGGATASIVEIVREGLK
ncbi:hypothetical protein TrCOL_g3581 [Triparma columacea]|uniref:Amino acid transporter transmembrane domain-containing protein n=1 Tax=Triparma columacea TaxID=722753 RepID=A0A9W7LAG4_9STRA|nr:hypothetical protein TrCOL_g3581 [Triparma columacea]